MELLHYTYPVSVYRVTWHYTSPVILVLVQPKPSQNKTSILLDNHPEQDLNHGAFPPQSNVLPIELS